MAITRAITGYITLGLALATVLVQCVQFSSAAATPAIAGYHYGCKPPTQPSYGSFHPVQKFYRIGQRVTFRCNKGYKLVGKSSSVCIIRPHKSPYWSNPSPTCKLITCPRLSAPKYGSVKVTGYFRPGSVAKYSCKPGFKLVGTSTRKCLSNGYWSGKAPTCRSITCPRLSAPKYGSVKVTGYFRPGSVAKYSCKPGFRLVGASTRKCLSNGYWSGKAPTCRPITCPRLSAPKYGSVKVTGYFRPGSVAKYSCKPGFKLVGTSTRKCLSNGYWSGKAPTCRPITCPRLSAPKYGSVKVTGYFRPGSVAKYSCKPGFRLVGASTRKCLSNGYWSGKAPTCRPITCPRLSAPKYGSVKVTGYFRPGSIAKYSCKPGFRLVGASTRKCLSNGYWSGKAPTCRPITCPRLSAPKYGSVKVTGYFRPGSVAKYSCKPGFRLVGASTRKCLSNGYWSGKAPTCRPITCPRLSAPKYGSVKVTGYFRPGSVAKYSCKPGFRLVGASTRKCLSNGYWSGKAPTCRPITCPRLSAPKYGSVKVTGYFRPGSVAKYSCKPGFRLVGASTRKCLSNGYWSGKAPTCRPITCPRLSAPKYGSVKVTGYFRPGSVAKYSCKPGFRLVGASTRKCLSNGYWSGKAPTCRPITCPRLSAPKYGSVKVTGYFRPGSVAKYSCKPGFRLVGASTRKCLSNGYWSGKAPTCRPITCPRLSAPKYGSVKVTGYFRPGSVAKYSCKPGFRLVGASTRKCLSNGYWSGKAPTCQRVVDCGKPPPVKNGYVSYTSTKQGGVAKYSCSKGYTLKGNRVRHCLPTGHWSGSTPKCVYH